MADWTDSATFMDDMTEAKDDDVWLRAYQAWVGAIQGAPIPKTVEQLLEAAKTAAKPLRDPGLEKKIDTAIEHVTTRSNPRTG